MQENPKSLSKIPLFTSQRLYTICKGASKHPDTVDRTDTGYNSANDPAVYIRTTVEPKNLCTIHSVWSKTTLITGSVGGT